MKVLSSRTILQLYVFGMIVVALPLLSVLVTAVLAVDDLLSQSRRAIFISADTVNASRLLVEQATDIARSGRQFLVLRDNEVYKVYAAARTELQATLGELSQANLDEAQRQILEHMRARERKVYESLEQYREGSGSAPELEEGFRDLANLARGMFLETSRLLSREARELRETAAAVERDLLIQALAVIPMTIALGAVFALFVARPLRQMSRGVRQLGRGEFGVPIQVTGARDLEELGRRLDWLRERLLGLEQQKVKFLRHVSHELKTPLATIRESGALLREEAVGPLNRRQSDIVEILNESSRRLQGLVEDLLHFSVEEPRQGPADTEPLALERLVRSVLSEQGILMAAKRLKVVKNLGRISVAGRESQLRVVVENLISNAIKYSPRGGQIEIILRERGGRAVLEVRDEGPGIDAGERERIFEAFYQGKTVMGPVKGTGLGLTIAKEYVGLHGGTIEAVDSSRGAHLRVSLPLTEHGRQRMVAAGQGLSESTT